MDIVGELRHLEIICSEVWLYRFVENVLSNNEHASPAIQIRGDGALFPGGKSCIGGSVINTRVPNHCGIIREICRHWLSGGTYSPNVVCQVICSESVLVKSLKVFALVIVDVQNRW